MTAPPSNAWRFRHPDLEPGEGAGLGLTPAGGVAMIGGDASVRQAVILLLSTTPGERVMRPTYGCSLHHLAFAPNDPTTAGLAIHAVRQALERWEPRIVIERLDAGPHPERPERLEVELVYRVVATRGRDELRFALDLETGGA
ncbi:MAG TPA: GPW/gp25 family protein [Trueperaceae bacterium]